MNGQDYRTPGICTFVRVFGIFCIVGGAIGAGLFFLLGAGAITTGAAHSEGAAVAGGMVAGGTFALACGFLFVGSAFGIVLFLIASVVDYLAQTSFYTQHLVSLQGASQQSFAAFQTNLLAHVAKPIPQPALAHGDGSFHYESNGEEAGPVSESELRGLFAEGIVNMTTRVYRSGDGEWREFRHFPELLTER